MPTPTRCRGSRSRGRRWSISRVLAARRRSPCRSALADIAPPAPGREALWVPWLFVLSIGPVFFAVSAQAPLMQRWFAAAPAAGDPVPALRRLEPRQLRRPARLSAARRAAAAARASKARAGPRAMCCSSCWSRPRRWPGAAPRRRRRRGRREQRCGARHAPDPAVARAFGGPVGPDAVDDHVPHHRHLRDAAAVGHPARRSTCCRSRSPSPRAAASPRTLVLLAPLVLCAAGAVTMIAGRTPEPAGRRGQPGHAVRRRRRAPFAPLRDAAGTRAPDPVLLVMSAGGALGGLFTALVAPLVFDWTWEHPLLILAAAALLPLGAVVRPARALVRQPADLRLALALLLLSRCSCGAIWLRRRVPSPIRPGACARRSSPSRCWSRWRSCWRRGDGRSSSPASSCSRRSAGWRSCR